VISAIHVSLITQPLRPLAFQAALPLRQHINGMARQW